MQTDVIRYAIDRFSLGDVLIAASTKGLVAVLLGDAHETLRDELARRFPASTLVDAGESLGDLVSDVVDVLELRAPGPSIMLDLRGTTFQRAVWTALREIPIGTRVSYTDVARRIGAPTSARAVATACAANPLAIVVPCHRVVTSDGKLSGYRWGVHRKRALLEKEAAVTDAEVGVAG